jgi:hypothetical protein
VISATFTLASVRLQNFRLGRKVSSDCAEATHVANTIIMDAEQKMCPTQRGLVIDYFPQR